MRNRTISGWILAAAMVLAAVPVMAQSDEGPILLPKKQIVKPVDSFLLVMCDLACNCKLDGAAKGRIEAGSSTRVKVELGQHMVVATTLDGADQAQKIAEVKSGGQTVVSLALQPVRDARIKAEKKAQEEKARPTSAALLVLCDLACNWKLDGVAKGRIEGGGSARATVDVGQHLVAATTEDGADQVKQFSEVKTDGQTVLSIELKPVREARLNAEQKARAPDPNDPASPHTPGIYLVVGSGSNKKLVPLEASEFKPKEKGMLVRVLAAVDGPEAKIKAANTQPEFYIYFNERGASSNQITFGSAISPSELLLLHLTNNGEKNREAFVIKVGPRIINNSDSEYVPFSFIIVGPAAYKVTLPAPLTPGEYGFLSLSNKNHNSDVLNLALRSQQKNPSPLWLFDFQVPGGQ